MPEEHPSGSTSPKRSYIWLDALLFILFCAVSVPGILRFIHGDLWLDEADYAIASIHSVDDNRWDISDKPDQPDLLIRLRHFHAPATALILRFAHRFGSDEETLRLPFVAAGALSVGMVYLCGLALFGARREIAAACALLVAITPANIRMASHAVPWAFIILELLCLLLSATLFAQTRRTSLLIWVGLVLGLLFVTSEVFFVAAAAALLAVLLGLSPEIGRFVGVTREQPTESQGAPAPVFIAGRDLIRGLVGAAAAFVTVSLIVWPAGLLRRHCLTMLRHYIDMRTSEAFPVNIGNQVYKTAPKWAYLWWYFNYYRPFFLCYSAGLTLVVLLVVWSAGRILTIRKPEPDDRTRAGAAVLLIFTVILLAAAHRAHIIGAEYLAHCLPPLTLCVGFVLLVIGRWSRYAGIAAIAAAAIVFIRWTPSWILPGMDERTQIPRWQEAARTIAPRWKEKDRLLLGPQSSNVAYWYLHEWAHVPLHDWQIGQFSLAGPGPAFLHNLTIGKYRWIVISSQFSDNVINAVDPRSMQILNGWQKALQSSEKGLGSPRLTVFRCPISAFE